MTPSNRRALLRRGAAVAGAAALPLAGASVAKGAQVPPHLKYQWPKTGALRTAPNPKTLKFGDYVSAALPKPPVDWGYDTAPVAWGSLGNDRYGDCVEAAAAHEVMVENGAVGRAVPFTDACVLGDYAAATGFDPVTGSGDVGTNLGSYMAWRKNHGIHDANGGVHKIAAYLLLNAGGAPIVISELVEAGYLFGAVQLAFGIPQSAYDAWYAWYGAGADPTHPPLWDHVAGSPTVALHVVPLIAHRNGYKEVNSWGTIVRVTDAFLKFYVYEAWAAVSVDFLGGTSNSGPQSPQGFNLAQLKADLAQL